MSWHRLPALFGSPFFGFYLSFLLKTFTLSFFSVAWVLKCSYNIVIIVSLVFKLLWQTAVTSKSLWINGHWLTVHIDAFEFIYVWWKLKIDEGRTMKHHINIFEHIFNFFRIAYISNNGFYGLRFAVLFKKSIKINKINKIKI